MHKRVLATRRAVALERLGEMYKIDFESFRKARFDGEHTEVFTLEAIVEAAEAQLEKSGENISVDHTEMLLEKISEVDGIGEVTMHKIRSGLGLE